MADVLIVGGGVIGLLLAKDLVQRSVSVKLIEKGNVGAEASWAGGGIVSPLYPWTYSAPITALASWAQNAYPELAAELKTETALAGATPSDRAEVLDGPRLAGAAGGRHQRHRAVVRRGTSGALRHEERRVGGGAVRRGHRQRLEEGQVDVHDVACPGRRRHVLGVEEAGRRLAPGTANQADAPRAGGQPPPQRGLHQALRIQADVGPCLAEAAPDRGDLAAGRGGEGTLPPAAGGHRDGLRDRRMAGDEVGEALLHHPGQPHGPVHGGERLGQRPRVDDVAEGREPAEEDVHAAIVVARGPVPEGSGRRRTQGGGRRALKISTVPQ